MALNRAVPTSGVTLIPQSGSDFVFDLTLEETYDLAAEVTRHPVEKGSDITDHVRVTPGTFSFRGVLVDNPRGAEADSTRAFQQYELLRGMVGQLFTAITSVRRYANLVLESANLMRTAADRTALTVEVKMVEVFFAEAAYVKMPKRLLAAKVKKAASETDNGKQATETPTAEGKISAVKAIYNFGVNAVTETVGKIQTLGLSPNLVIK